MRKDHISTTKDTLLDTKSGLRVNKKTFEEDAVICSSKPLLYPPTISADHEALTAQGTRHGVAANQRRPTGNGIGKRRHRNKNRKRGAKVEPEAGWILGALKKVS